LVIPTSRDVLELSLAVVAKEMRALIAADREQIEVAVVVEIGEGGERRACATARARTAPSRP
jgi:hypothetical protein